MKHIAQQMVLFGASAPLAENFAKAVKITPRFAVAKDDEGKTIKDKHGNAVLAKDENGQHIKVAETISILPRASKDKPCIKSLFPEMNGQGQMAFLREMSDGLCDLAIAEVTRLRASGQYTFGRKTRSLKNGAITLTFKPVFGGKSVVTSTDEELAKELERRGYSVEKPDTRNGEAEVEVETPEPEAPKPAAKKPGKGKTVPATA